MTSKGDRLRLPMVSFRADEEVFAVLKKLEVAVGPEVATKRKRSFAIRKALLEAGDRLSRGSKK